MVNVKLLYTPCKCIYLCFYQIHSYQTKLQCSMQNNSSNASKMSQVQSEVRASPLLAEIISKADSIYITTYFPGKACPQIILD